MTTNPNLPETHMDDLSDEQLVAAARETFAQLNIFIEILTKRNIRADFFPRTFSCGTLRGISVTFHKPL